MFMIILCFNVKMFCNKIKLPMSLNFNSQLTNTQCYEICFYNKFYNMITFCKNQNQIVFFTFTLIMFQHYIVW
jgi:hypothetical protein